MLSVFICALYKMQTKLCLLMLYLDISDCGLADPFRMLKEGQIYREDPGRGQWSGHGSVSKTIGPESLFLALAPAAQATETLWESEAWSESPQQYCTLCVAASSPWAGVTAERRAEEGNCCLTTIMGSLKYIHTQILSGKNSVVQSQIWLQ